MENAKMEKFKCDIFSDFQTLWKWPKVAFWIFKKVSAHAILSARFLFLHFFFQIAPALLVTSVFDREVNCRRAASAAFQESVGRLGAEAVPHGIDLLTTCDYHSVGIRAHTYTDLSVKVAEKSPEYAVKLVEHLLEKKICHWDNSVRELTGQALR